MPAGDLLNWTIELFLLGLGAFAVATIALLFAARGLERRFDRVIEVLERLDNPIEDMIDYSDKV